MSENLKEKQRAARRAKTHTAAAKQVAINKQHGGTVLPIGRFKKQHAMDCGQPRCGLCSDRHNPTRKLKDQLTLQELSSLEAHKLDEGIPPELEANDSQYQQAA